MYHSETEFESRCGLAPLSSPMQRFAVIDRDSPLRTSAESRVSSGYSSIFGACLKDFMPYLALYRSPDGGSAIIGYRPADVEQLYLEQYLDLPVEKQAAVSAAVSAERREIVEVGQFVIDDRELVEQFFRDLVPFLLSLGFRWIVFTATRQIRYRLLSAGFRGLAIAVAHEAHADRAADRWGTYYHNDPLVILGSLADPAGRWCRGRHQSMRHPRPSCRP